MSTTSAPRGLKPIGLLGGMPFAGSTDDGYLVRESAAGEVNPIGVFLGCSYTDPNTGQPTHRQYYPGGISASDIKAVVSINPTTLYEVQADGQIAQAKLGQTIDLAQTASGNTTTGNSGLQADASTAAITGGTVNGYIKIPITEGTTSRFE